MQTFVPFPDLRRTAEVLDDKRLGKQRVEALQIIRALTRETYGWKRHPAVRMWEGHVEALALYAAVICEEWTKRGHADTCDATIRRDLADAGIAATDIPTTQDEADLPHWWGDDAVHRSHRSALLRKEPEHYRHRFEPDLPDDLPYVWPAPASR
jgi:hypothetical protein